jgi:hypothetical protein
MKIAVNLRGDLAKLSDAELAERLNAAWEAIDASEGRRQSWWPLGKWRGPVRHRGAYRLLSVLPVVADTEPGWLASLLALSSKRLERLLEGTTIARYRHLCEIQDIMDEMECRVSRNRPSPPVDSRRPPVHS